MQLFCPTCQAAFPGTQRCPKCGGLLLMPHEAATASPRFGGQAEDIRPTSLGRILVGTVVALGLYLGLRKLTTAWVLSHEVDADGWWLTADGRAALFCAQGVAAVVGAVLAAAGRRGGFAIGAAVAGLCGGLFLGAELLATGAAARDIVFYLQPLILAVAGGIAGAVSTRVWVAPPVLDMPAPAHPSKLSSIHLQPKSVTDSARPTRWAQVMLGAGIMLAGFVAAEQLRRAAQTASGGMLKVSSLGQGQFFSWQVATVVIGLGGVVAAAGSGAGVRHGFLAGAVAAAGAVGMNAAGGGPNAPSEYWLSKINLSGLPATDPNAMAGVAAGVMLAALVGGILGSVLLPPIAPPHMRQKLAPVD